ncbi:MAG: sugar phosphate isomerase/epimerase [Planctomycetes bacterium]|nr:sugar phosphate isomerase/epimerase [Planctomycetota bacterium]MBL7039592.1 sugar phosphate isomerase/epimerase [Pirellulaceae bacterium]
MGQQRIIPRLAVLLALGLPGLATTGWAEEPSDNKGLDNPLFAMNFARSDPMLAASPEAQAALLRELGYDGCQYLGPLEQLDATLDSMDKAGLDVFTVAVPGYNISVDPGSDFDPTLKQAIRQLKDRKTLFLIGFASKDYERSSPDGDVRAVEVCRQLADFAQPLGVRVAIYPHVNQWCERVEDALRIAQKTDRENLGICFNLYHWLRTDQERKLEPLVAASMSRLFLVTINGTSPEGSMEALDRGAYDVYQFLKPFVAGGYSGPIGLQCVGVKGEPRDNLTRSMAAWRKLSVRLRTVSGQ